MTSDYVVTRTSVQPNHELPEPLGNKHRGDVRAAKRLRALSTWNGVRRTRYSREMAAGRTQAAKKTIRSGNSGRLHRRGAAVRRTACGRSDRPARVDAASSSARARQPAVQSVVGQSPVRPAGSDKRAR